MADDQNIVLLTVDALRSDHVSAFEDQTSITPNIDSFANSNIACSHAFSVSSHTREAVPSLLSGQYPNEAVSDDYALATRTVAEILSDNGFATGAFHSNPYVSRAYGYGNEFDTFSDDLYLGQHRFLALAQRAFDKIRGRNYARGTEINRDAIKWFFSTKSPKFLWCHYMDVHGPYEPPEQYLDGAQDKQALKNAQSLYNQAVDEPASISDEERQLLQRLYQGEVRCTDDFIGDFLAELRSLDALDETLVIISADHGEAFGEHGYYSHPRKLHDELIDVPLIISGPSKGTVDTPVSTIDIVPTILDGADVDSKSLPGTSVFEMSNNEEKYDDRIIFSQARTNDESCVFSARTKTETCFLERDIETGEILHKEGEMCSKNISIRLQKYSESHLARASGDETSTEASEEIERRLEALGYRES